MTDFEPHAQESSEKDIHSLITRKEEVELTLQGKKRAQRRNSRLADPGAVFTVGGQAFVMTEVFRQSLGELTDADAQEEGFADLEAYKNSILSIHPGMPWLPAMKVWVHRFCPQS